MGKILPFLEVNGQKYEIKPTRYLLVEYSKIGDESNLSDKDKTNAIKAKSLLEDIQRYAEKVQELWERFTETYDDEDERRYLKAKSLHEKAVAEFAEFEVETESTTKLQKASIDALEKIAIKGLAEQHFGMDESKATAVWCAFVDEIGKNNVVEWLTAMSECLFTEEEKEDDNSFLSQMRRSKEMKHNRKKR